MHTVILCGGKGTRLSEETQLKPKPMVEVGPHPILWHILKYYRAFGHRHFTLALGYKSEVIKEYFLNYQAHKSDLTIDLSTGKVEARQAASDDWVLRMIDTGEDTNTGGRVRRLRELLTPDGTFMLTYGDGVSNVDIRALLEFHKSHGKIATVTAVRPPARFGSIVMEKGLVKEFKEKPQTGEGWINGGFFVLEPAFFDFIDGDTVQLEREPMEKCVAAGELMAFQHPGFWHPMDTIRDRQTLVEMWERGTAPWKIW